MIPFASVIIAVCTVFLMSALPVFAQTQPSQLKTSSEAAAAVDSLEAAESADAAEAPPDGDEPVEVEAQTLTYEEESDTVTASGDVVVTKGQTTVTADSVGVNRTTSEVEAKGNVVVTDPQGTIEADALQFEMDDETGLISNGTIRLPRNQYTITGKTLQKSFGQTYHIEDGSITTCQCDDPKQADWRIGAKTLDLTRRGRGVVRGGVLRVRDIPAFYLPYAVFPVQTDRQSGLLFPKNGFSSKRGFQWEQPFFWAINKSHDVTITTDVETAARIGILGEYRYAPNRHTEGHLIASYFNEEIRGPASTRSPLNRWSLTGTHRQLLPNDTHLYGDFFFVGDNRFLREMNVPYYAGSDDTELRSRRWTRSRAGGVKTWQQTMLRADAFYFQDLRNDDDYAFHVLPNIQFQTNRWLWNDRLEAGLKAEGANFFREKGYYGQRFDIAPWVSLPFSLGGYVFGSLNAIGHETIYHMSSREQGQPALDSINRLDWNPTRETVELRADIRSRLSRVFTVNWGSLQKIKHVVEPHVSYTYIPVVDQNDLPLFDGLDRINRRSLFAYGVSNRILGKFAASPQEIAAGAPPTRIRELARLSVLQVYDPSRRLREGSSNFGLSETEQHFSDVSFDARLNPVPFMSIWADTIYDIDKADVTAARVGAYLTDPRPLPPTTPLFAQLQRRTSVGIFYRTISDRLLKELNANVIFRLNEYFSAAYFTRYDLNDKSFIGNRYFFRILSPQKCWAFDFGVVDKVNPSEVEFRFALTLVGLSSFGRQAF